MKLRAYKRFFNGFSLVEKGIMGLLLLLDIVLTAANVFSRYVIHQSWSFTEEVVVAVLVLMSLIGAALCARERGGLINLTLFTGKFPKTVQLIVEILMTLALVFFAFVMVKYGAQRCLDQIATGRVTSSLQIPEWYYSSFVPIGGGLILLHSVERIVDCCFEYFDYQRKGGGEE